MKLDQLRDKLGFRPLVILEDRTIDICSVYAGDRMSDLLAAASGSTLLVTHLTNHGIVRLIDLMDVPAICFLNGVHPDQDVLYSAKENETFLFTSPYDMYETCGRLFQLLNQH